MPRSHDDYPWLLADIGGTNARFGLLRHYGGKIEDVRSFKCDAYDSPEVAALAYLAAVGERDGVRPRPRHAALALATVIDGDVVRMTNSHWQVTKPGFRTALGLEHVLLLNDFEALALSLPRLGTEDLSTLGGPGLSAVDATRPMAVIGPGTGLGVAASVPAGDGRWLALSTEGGHSTLAAGDDFEAELLQTARREHGHVSAERMLSGIGLPNLHRAVLLALGLSPQTLSAEQITAGAAAGDAACVRTLETFCAMLGGFTGNAALMLGARGGVLVAGGIAQLLGERLRHSRFRERFEAKGRFSDYLAPIATCLVTAPHAALAGAAQGIENALRTS